MKQCYGYRRQHGHYVHTVVPAKESEIGKQGVRPCMLVASRDGWFSVPSFLNKIEAASSENDGSYAGVSG
jgi:hypothetical protein